MEDKMWSMIGNRVTAVRAVYLWRAPIDALL
jgi:hypothetical protein